MTLTQIEAKAKKAVEMGAAMTFEEIVAMYLKKEKKSKKKDSKKWNKYQTIGTKKEVVKDGETAQYFEDQREKQMKLYSRKFN